VHHSLYAHLWSIEDRGQAGFVEDLRRAGLNAVSFAATYHAVRQLMPANPARQVFYAPRSHAYFPPRGRYGRLAPEPSPLVAGRDTLGDLSQALSRSGMRCKTWVIGCHNSDLAGRCPDLAIVNALGDRLPHHLCPARGEVQQYLASLLADIAGHYDLHAIEMESFGYSDGFEHGAHHEMSGLVIDAWHSRLLSLCFCPGCLEAATAAGVAADALAVAIRQELLEWMDTPAWKSATPEVALAFAAAHPELAAFLGVRRRVTHDLGQRLREAVHAVAPETLLIDLGGGQASPAPDLLDWADGLVVRADAVTAAAARQTLGPSAYVGCGVYPMAPRPLTPEQLREALTACAAAGCDGFNYYNHALMQRSTWHDLREAIAALAG